jgi:hypothetical protein
MATKYVVLQFIVVGEGDSEGWQRVGDNGETFDGATPQAAIKAATNGKPAAERTGTFVAVPARSWKPISRRVESVEKESWE